jgi:hypothetical protein
MTQPPHDQQWRQIDWDTIESEMARVIAELAQPRMDDTASDRCIMSFIVELEDVFLDFARRAGPPAFRRAARKTDHVTELKRVLTTLGTLLTGWEAIVEPKV